jgi:hypothetical protein
MDLTVKIAMEPPANNAALDAKKMDLQSMKKSVLTCQTRLHHPNV